MSRSARIFLIVVLTIFALLTTTVAFAAVAIVRQGTIGVSVHEKGAGGADVSLTVPAFLVTGALQFVPDTVVMPEEAAIEVEPWLPSIRALSNELADCPDAVFVQVVSRRENVLIAKRSGQLVVEVRSDDADVDVRIPLRAVDSVMAKLERAARRG